MLMSCCLALLIGNFAPLTLWLIGGVFLLLIGFLGLTIGLNVLIGFLWVIDLGVGLIFLLFLAHLTVFLETSAMFVFSSARLRTLTLAGLVLMWVGVSNGGAEISGRLLDLSSSLVNYFSLWNDVEVSQLSLLREAFFYSNVWGFYVINLLALISLLGLIIFQSAIRRDLTRTQVLLPSSLNETNAALFIRDQNFLAQQQTAAVVRIWTKEVNPLK